jgi:LSD1 subclass zinc finger protein
MNITVHCPQCDSRIRFPGTDRAVTCDACRNVLSPTPLPEGGTLGKCAVCEEQRLYRQKDLRRNQGLAVVLGTAAISLALLPFSPAAAYAVLFLLALVDFALYRRLPEVIICYRCKAEHRRCGEQAQIEPFDLLTAEVIDNQIRRQEEKNPPARA